VADAYFDFIAPSAAPTPAMTSAPTVTKPPALTRKVRPVRPEPWAPPPGSLSIAEVAALFGVGVAMALRWARAGRLPSARKVDGRWVVDRFEVLALRQRCA
jgi:hypothetical protein